MLVSSVSPYIDGLSRLSKNAIKRSLKMAHGPALAVDIVELAILRSRVSIKESTNSETRDRLAS